MWKFINPSGKMSKWEKIHNLKRLNRKYKFLVISYILKALIKVKPTKEEIEAYIFYNFLLQFEGHLIKESSYSLTARFKNGKNKVIKLRKPPSSDFDVFKQIFYWKEYLPVVKCYQEQYKPEANLKLNILDCGSNIGLTSLFFLDFFPGSRIVAIEPEIGNFKNLSFNLDQTGLSQVVKIRGAIWSKNTQIKIVRDFRDKNDWSFRVEETNEADSIKAFSIKQIMKDYSIEFIDILKIDIEGAEKEIFTSKGVDLDFLNVTRCLAIEIHDEYNCREKIYEILEDKGFDRFNSGELTIAYNRKLKNELNPSFI